MSIFTTEDKALHAAAVRAGVRTAAQTARGVGAAVLASIGASIAGVDWVTVGGVAAAGALTIVWSGVDAYLGMINGGVPPEYTAAPAGSRRALRATRGGDL